MNVHVHVFVYDGRLERERERTCDCDFTTSRVVVRERSSPFTVRFDGLAGSYDKTTSLGPFHDRLTNMMDRLLGYIARRLSTRIRTPPSPAGRSRIRISISTVKQVVNVTKWRVFWSITILYLDIFIYFVIMARMLEGCRIWVRWGEVMRFVSESLPRLIISGADGSDPFYTPDACFHNYSLAGRSPILAVFRTLLA